MIGIILRLWTSGSVARHCGLAQWRFLVRKSKPRGGSIPGFQSWLIEPNEEVLEEDAHTEAVAAVLDRIDYGVFS
jgi:hypothetical protein